MSRDYRKSLKLVKAINADIFKNSPLFSISILLVLTKVILFSMYSWGITCMRLPNDIIGFALLIVGFTLIFKKRVN